MTPTEPIFLETVSATTRKALVSQRLAAMHGRLGEVCVRLKALVAATPLDERSDLVALGLLWSELLHLDGQDGESLAVFKEVVEPQQPLLPIPVQLVTTDNLSVLQMKNSP